MASSQWAMDMSREVFKLLLCYWRHAFLNIRRFVKVCLNGFFFQKLKQTHINLANQTGNSASTWTTNDGIFLVLRARLSVLELCVHGIWMSSEQWKLFFKIFMSSKLLAKAGPFFWFWNHLHQLRTIHFKCKSNCLRFLIHYIAQMRASLSPSEVATDSFLYSLLPLNHQNLPVCYTTLVPNRFSDFSMIHL